MPPRHAIVCSPRAADRLEMASRWLQELEPSAEVMVLAARQPAADDLVRGLKRATRALRCSSDDSGAAARRALRRASVLATVWCRPPDSALKRWPRARSTRSPPSGALGYFAPVADRPGFPGALARTLGEVRLAGIGADELAALDEIGAPLAAMLRQFEAELHEAHLIDRAAMLALAAAIVKADPPPHHATMPILMLDVAVGSTLERELYAALAARAPAMLATVPEGDTITLAMLTAALGVTPPPAPRAGAAAKSIARLQDYLFSRETPPERAARRHASKSFRRRARCRSASRSRAGSRPRRDRGVPFDRIAVALHAPARYVPYLEEALARAAIPAYFARGASAARAGRPRAAGAAGVRRRASLRAPLRRVPFARAGSGSRPRRTGAASSPPTLKPPAPRRPWSLRPPRSPGASAAAEIADGADPVPVVEGALRAPWRWERLLVDASVIGSRERWERRLRGLGEELESGAPSSRTTTFAPPPSIARFSTSSIWATSRCRRFPRSPRCRRRRPGANGWRICARSRRSPCATRCRCSPRWPSSSRWRRWGRSVSTKCAWCWPSGSGRLEAPRRGAATARCSSRRRRISRGLDFDVVIVPGLAERVFPKKLTEDPILPDAARMRLGRNLELQQNRVAAERLALRLAAGAARGRVMFSYPRVDLDQGRPRVPSFYALEVLRAAEGRLPGFDELAKRAAGEQAARLGWPAPREAAAGDRRRRIRSRGAQSPRGPGSRRPRPARRTICSDANPHLARALRARARRWLQRWTPADGLVDPGPEVRARAGRASVPTRVPIRPPRCSISRPARIAFCC